MSLTGIDTSQLVSRFTTSESQKEWGDVQDALAKAFPDQSMEELHAAATALLLETPGMDMGELVSALADKFSVSISTEMANQIRTEWEQFNAASGLNASELIAVLDDYSGDAIDTKSQKYMMFLIMFLRQELEELSTETDQATSEADGKKTLEEIEEMMEAANKEGKDANSAKSWIGAALAIVGVVAAVFMAIPTMGLSMVAALPMGVMAVTATVSAATGEDFSPAAMLSEFCQVLGIPKGVSDVIGGIMEALMVIGSFVCGMGFTALLMEAPRIVEWIDGCFERGGEMWGSEEDDDTKELDGSENVDVPDYDMTDDEKSGLRAAIEQLVKMLQAKGEIDAAALDAIFSDLSDNLGEEGQAYLDAVLNNADADIV